MRNPFRRDYDLMAATWEWNALARYNAECGRGIVHTQEWSEHMAREQERFDVQQAVQRGEDLSTTREREQS